MVPAAAPSPGNVYVTAAANADRRAPCGNMQYCRYFSVASSQDRSPLLAEATVTTALDPPLAPDAAALPAALAAGLPLAAGVLALRDGVLVAEWLNPAATALGLAAPALGLSAAAQSGWLAACRAR